MYTMFQDKYDLAIKINISGWLDYDSVLELSVIFYCFFFIIVILFYTRDDD